MAISTTVRLAHRILSDFVDAGVLEAGERLPTVRELAERYDTSRNTVAHALGILEAQGYIVKRQGSGCFLAEKGVNLSMEAKTIGLVLPFSLEGESSTPEMMLDIYRGVATSARAHDYHVIVAASGWDYETERSEVWRLVRGGCRVIVLYPTMRTHKELAKDYLNSELLDFPIILLDMAFTSHKRPQVLFDNYGAAFAMTRKLLENGHRRIAFIRHTGPEGEFINRSTQERYLGYQAALAESGLSPNPVDIWTLSTDFDLAREIPALMDVWEAMRERPSALIALEDEVARWTIDILEARGYAPHKDLEVVGFDNKPSLRDYRIPFPTSDPDFTAAASMATELALRAYRGDLPDILTYMLPLPVLWRHA